MKIIQEGSESTAKIIAKNKISGECLYRVSDFVFFYTESDNYLIKNTMSGQVIKLTEGEWKALMQIKDNSVDFGFLSENGLLELARLRFIVETDYDEAEQYKQTVTILKIMSKDTPGFKRYTILPTTGCNARCVYCYEMGYASKTMSLETADRLIEFISETKCNGTVRLAWFGGEPLAAKSIISYICKALTDRGISFKSSMITNASLMTKEIAHEAKEIWNLKNVQVSLDGYRADYEKRKNYFAPQKHNYDVVMRAIHYLADEGIKVSLRVNFDWENISNMKKFLDEIKAEFGDMENISLHLAMLYQEKNKDTCTDLYKKMFELNNYINEIGITQGSKIENSARLKLNYCMADSMDKNIVIDPDGNFYNCEHLPEDTTWGNIFDGITDKARFDELSKPADIDEKCRHCCFLPQCTPFYKRGCPNWFEYCHEYNCLKTIYSLQRFIKYVDENGEGHDENV